MGELFGVLHGPNQFLDCLQKIGLGQTFMLVLGILTTYAFVATSVDFAQMVIKGNTKSNIL